jgi:trehalose utilization protein
MSSNTIKVTVWNEFVHEREDPATKAVYPDGIHTTIAQAIGNLLGPAAQLTTATLEQPEHGLSEATLAQTDVLVWWGHAAHKRVADDVVDRVQRRVHDGMGLIALHSAHESKIFMRLMGRSCSLRWREADDRELVWLVNPSHPIAAGVPPVLVLPRQEMYGEYFDIPQPDDLIFISSFTGGEVFRSGCTFTRGLGKIFYFSPGHETFPVYHDPNVQRVLANAVLWARHETHLPYSTAKSAHSPVGWFEHQ